MNIHKRICPCYEKHTYSSVVTQSLVSVVTRETGILWEPCGFVALSIFRTIMLLEKQYRKWTTNISKNNNLHAFSRIKIWRPKHARKSGSNLACIWNCVIEKFPRLFKIINAEREYPRIDIQFTELQASDMQYSVFTVSIKIVV